MKVLEYGNIGMVQLGPSFGVCLLFTLGESLIVDATTDFRYFSILLTIAMLPHQQKTPTGQLGPSDTHTLAVLLQLISSAAIHYRGRLRASRRASKMSIRISSILRKNFRVFVSQKVNCMNPLVRRVLCRVWRTVFLSRSPMLC